MPLTDKFRRPITDLRISITDRCNYKCVYCRTGTGGAQYDDLPLADYARMLRLFVLETAWKIDNTSTAEARTDIAAVKFTMAKVLREVSFNALHILGSLGTTDLTPIQAMYAAAPTMGIADGVDEVHKVTVARNVLKGYKPHEGLWPTEYFPAKREEARKKYAELLANEPDLAAYSEAAERRMMRA